MNAALAALVAVLAFFLLAAIKITALALRHRATQRAADRKAKEKPNG